MCFALANHFTPLATLKTEGMILPLRKRHRLIWICCLPAIGLLFWLALDTEISLPPAVDSTDGNGIHMNFQTRDSRQFLFLQQEKAFDAPAVLLYAYTAELEEGLLLGNVSTRGRYELPLPLPGTGTLTVLRWVNPHTGEVVHQEKLHR